MSIAQNGVCAICRHECERGRALSVDHDHCTGQIRGLLCSNCNLVLGLFGDNPELFMAAADYVTSHKTKEAV